MKVFHILVVIISSSTTSLKLPGVSVSYLLASKAASISVHYKVNH